ncbi:MAG: preprotein translocase subunit YajC [Alphaproteobacteria bacterium]|nr:preprotein translocase subunit YajC [Alphaproteobacteria bacterium]MCW5742768.1 preprotein translocase subunit YajC [Alphaproteobacteria bacterium]
MFISEAYAQAAGGGGGMDGLLSNIAPLILIFVVFYFLLIRPQQRRAREHREMLASVRRGDQVVTGGGFLGKVTKVLNDNEIEIELAEGLRVRALKGTLQNIVSRGEPTAKEAANKEAVQKPTSVLGGLFGGRKK